MKKVFISSIVAILILGFCGCSRSLSIGAVENNTTHKMSASYIRSTGTHERKITLEEGEIIEVSVKIKTESGSIAAFISREDKVYYEGHDIETSSFTVSLADPGEYTIQVDTNKHKGGYTFEW